MYLYRFVSAEFGKGLAGLDSASRSVVKLKGDEAMNRALFSTYRLIQSCMRTSPGGAQQHDAKQRERENDQAYAVQNPLFVTRAR